jgi:DNA-nicking Smr family endonuclease
MDFGDILDQWDRETANPKGKKTAAKRRGEKIGKPGTERVDPLTAWLRINGVVDKDAEIAETAGESNRGERRRRLLAKKPDAALDLHGLTRDEAWLALDNFFRAGHQQGFDKLLIIHGKGNHSEKDGVLKRTVRNFIERCAFAGESGQGSPAEGGSGATWVFLK